MKKFFFILLLIFLLPSIINSATLNLEIAKGWNLKSSYLKEVKTSDFKDVNSLWKWNGNNWLIWSPKSEISELVKNYGIESFSSIYAGEGFWINSNTEETVSFNGNLNENGNLSASKGWMLLGLKKDTPVSIEKFNKSFINSVWKWENNSWSIYSPVSTINELIKKYKISQIDSIKPVEGFWLNANENGTISFDESDNKSQGGILTLSYSASELSALYNNISIFDPVIISFNESLNYDNDSLKSFKLISVINLQSQQIVKGHFTLSQSKKDIIFFPDKPLKPGTVYGVTVAKEIKSSSLSTMAQDVSFKVQTSSANKIIDIIASNENIISGEKVNFSYKFYGKISKVASVKWDKSPFNDNNNISSSKSIDYEFGNYGISRVRLTVTDNYGREFSQTKDISVFRDLSKFFSSEPFNQGENITLSDSFWQNTLNEVLFNSLQKYSDKIISIYKTSPPDNLTKYFPSAPVIAIEMEKDIMEKFKNNYVKNLKNTNSLIGFALYKGFPAILSFRTDGKTYYFDMLFDDADINLDTSYNGGKLKLKNIGLDVIPTLFRISIKTDTNTINAIKNIFQYSISSFSDLKFIDFKNGKILYKAAVQSSSIKKSGVWSTVCDYASAAVDEAGDYYDAAVEYVETALDKIKNYLSDIAISVLKGIKTVFNKIKGLSVLTKLSNVKEDFTDIKDKVTGNLNKFTSSVTNISDPEKLFDKLKELLVNSGDSIKSLFELFVQKLQAASGSFASVANLLLDNINNNNDSTVSDLKNTISEYIPIDKAAYFQFKISPDGEIAVNVKLGDNVINLSVDTINDLLAVPDWTSVLDFPLSDLKNLIVNIKNALSDLPMAIAGVYYEPAFYPVNDNLHFDIKFETSDGNQLFKFITSLKPSNPSVLMKISSPVNFNDYFQFLFYPYSMKVVEPEDNESLTSIYSSLVDTVFENISNFSFPNAEMTFHVENLFGKFNVDISSELLPTPNLSAGGKLEIGLSEHAIIGGGGKISPQVYTSFPVNIGSTAVGTIFSTSFNSVKDSISSLSVADFSNPDTFCNITDNLMDDLEDNLTTNVLNNIRIGFGVQSSGEIGVGAGGTGAGASADAELSVGIDMSSTLSNITALFNSSGNACLFSFKDIKNILNFTPDISLKTLPLMMLQPISNISVDSSGFWENFAENFSLSFGAGISGDVEGNVGVGGDLSVGVNYGFGVNGEYLLNTIYYFIKNDDDSTYKIRKFDHPTIYPEISFGISYGAEVTGGVSLPIGLKSSLGLSMDTISGTITLPTNPFLNNTTSGSAFLKMYPIVKISTQSSGKDAIFNSSIELETGTTIASYHWYIDGIRDDNVSGISQFVGSLPAKSANQLHVIFGNHGEFPVVLTVTDSKGRETSYSIAYSVPNSAPTTPTLNISENAKLHKGDKIIFSSNDADGDSITYIAEIADDTNFSVNKKTFTLNTNFINLNNIEKGQHYIRVKAFDGEKYSEWSSIVPFSIANSKPTVTIESVTDSYDSYSKACQGFKVNYYAYDEDNDPVTVEVVLYKGDSTGDDIATIPCGSGKTSCYVFFEDVQNDEFAPNNYYFIQLRGFDGTAYGPLSSKTYFTLCKSISVKVALSDNEINVGENVSFTVSTPGLDDAADDSELANKYYAIVEVATDTNFQNIVYSDTENYSIMDGWEVFDKWAPSNSGTYYVRAKLYQTTTEQNQSDVLKDVSDVTTLTVNGTSQEQVKLSDDFNTIDSWSKKTPGNGTYTLESIENTFHYKRENSGAGDFTGLEKSNLNIDISQCSEAYMEFDVKVMNSSLTNSGWWTYNYGGYGEFPANVILHFTDSNGNNFVWNHGFLFTTDSYNRANYTVIGKGEWYHYKSPNLVNEKTTATGPKNQAKQSGTIKKINYIFIGGNGHNFEGYYDNFKITCK